MKVEGQEEIGCANKRTIIRNPSDGRNIFVFCLYQCQNTIILLCSSAICYCCKNWIKVQISLISYSCLTMYSYLKISLIKREKNKNKMLQASRWKHFFKKPFKVRNFYLWNIQWKLRYWVIIYRLLRAKDYVSRKLYPAEIQFICQIKEKHFKHERI